MPPLAVSIMFNLANALSFVPEGWLMFKVIRLLSRIWIARFCRSQAVTDNGADCVVNAGAVKLQLLRPPTSPSDACTRTLYVVLAASPLMERVRLVVVPAGCHGSDGVL